MKEKAHVFFTLLNQSYKIEAEQILTQISVSTAPHMKEDKFRDMVDSYKKASMEPADLFAEDNDYSNIHKLKEALKKK